MTYSAAHPPIDSGSEPMTDAIPTGQHRRGAMCYGTAGDTGFSG